MKFTLALIVAAALKSVDALALNKHHLLAQYDYKHWQPTWTCREIENSFGYIFRDKAQDVRTEFES